MFPKQSSFHALLFFLFLICFSITLAGPIRITGRLQQARTMAPVAYANILLVGTSEGTVSDDDGSFRVNSDKLPVEIRISHIAYRDTLILAQTVDLGIIYLQSAVIRGQEVLVSALRAVEGKTPVAFSNLTSEEIDAAYSVEDVPMILSMEPGIYAYSESGNGTGYSYVSIRGFDQSRIAVMLDNVPLNDNESHQVYWVDHADILSDAQDVQIQRGIGNSLYGSSAFGGSINVATRIWSETPEIIAKIGAGSYNTSKLHLKANSGALFGQNMRISTRISQILSDGYRENHDSEQRAFSLGIEHRVPKMTNQFRAFAGYENTQLLWDGVHASEIGDREKRRAGYRAYTDDFLQQIYSLNTQLRIKKNWYLSNTAYLVHGRGYYEVAKSGVDFYSYNLDVDDLFSDDEEQEMTTDLLRRKWIVNTYLGVIPTLTLNQYKLRVDIGGELRVYKGDHFGEVGNFSEKSLATRFRDSRYEYYRYQGRKNSGTAFVHLAFHPLPKLNLVGDLQYQLHRWELDQELIGHAAGHQLNAEWNFLNPRLGAVYSFTENISAFVNYGRAQKEPADDQIINADDVWSDPVMAAAEAIDDYEIGLNYISTHTSASLNLYHIRYDNEQLKNIDVGQEGEYDYYAADATIHQGIEFDLQYRLLDKLAAGINGSFSRHVFSSGDMKDNVLPNVPAVLLNGSLRCKVLPSLALALNLRYVGQQYLDTENIGKIDPFFLADAALRLRCQKMDMSLKINNLFNRLYSTYGYGYEWDGYQAYYWPGATRNFFFTVGYRI